LSEHDWQATVLAELGVPRSGLVTPDSSRSSAPTGKHAAPAADDLREPPPAPPAPRPAPVAKHRSAPPAPESGPGEEWSSPPPAAPQRDESPAQNDAPPPEPSPRQFPPPEQWGDQPAAHSGEGVPAAGSPVRPADAAPPSAQVWSAPAAPEPGQGDGRPDERSGPAPTPWPQEPPPEPSRAGEPAERPAGWQPPEWDAPPPDERAQQPHPAPRPEDGRGQLQDGPGQPPEEAAPNQAAAWELASQTSWGLVAQTPWGTEPPPEDEPPRQDWEHQQAEAWRRDPASQPPAPGPPPAPAPQPPPGPPQQAQPDGMAPQDLVRRSAHGDPLSRRLSRGVRRAVGASAADEVRKTADVEAVLSRQLPSSRQIAVTSIRGGAGKTTVAGLTATVIAQYRQDRVLAVDADSGLGSLPLRLGVRTERSLHDLTAAGPRTFDEAARFLGRTADGLWVLSGTAGGRITHELDLATFKAAAGQMSRYFSALVVDCGAGLLPELQRGILADAHAQVMVTPGTVDGALSARGALEWQARNGYQHLLTRTVIAFVTHTPHVDADLTRGAQLLSGGGMPVVHLPYDRHLATGTAVESARIGQETRAAAIRVAVEAFARATSV
jgi:MinD-like ATPase involved in chromosome partitioning or flagellar assembly